VEAVPGRFNDFGLSKDERVKALLLQAWTAYATALGAPLNGAVIAEPNWKAALVKSGSLESFVPAVETVLADARVPKTFGLLVTAAAVVAPAKPGEAIALLQRAKPMMPRDGAKADVNQAARLYGPLVDLLAPDRLPDAIKEQREFVQLSGRGQARLMLLLRQSGDGAATQTMLASLIEPKVDQREVGLAAPGLFKLGRDAKTPDSKANEQAVTLLQAYLAAPRTRDLAEELGARRALGNYYLNQKNWAETQTVLTFQAPAPQDVISPAARSKLRDIERLKVELQKMDGAKN